ncbi:hypothetical protein [Pseudonocardia ailaonensis]|uniref:hypothetical protein n=1 Tax=Pseudonocardia ailaonensis TaxID=367279 RepID=UPI0031E462EB
MSAKEAHQVAVTVFLTVEGIDDRDAVNRAEQTIAVATDRTPGVYSVIETSRALRAGRFSVEPARRPR